MSLLLPLMTHCPMCRGLYPTEGIKLIAERSRVKLFHSTCSTCGHGLFCYIIENGGGVGAVGLVTDASALDAMRLFDASAISSEYCISAHKVIFTSSRKLCQDLLDISGKLA